MTAPEKPAAPSQKPHYHGHRERLRGKLLDVGPSALADYEVLELLLCAFIPRRDVKPVAKDLLSKFGGLSGVFAAAPERLSEVSGIGDTVIAYLKAVHEANIRASREAIAARDVISSFTALQAYLKVALQHEPVEQFRILFLDHKNQLIADEQQNRGTVAEAPVYPREVARRAIELSASSLILVHNHPSGDPTPSSADISITRDLIDALEPLDIRVHDHLVVGRQGVASLRAAGKI